MSLAPPLAVTTPSDTEIVVERSFDAPAALVFDCHTRAEFVTRWLTGPEGWTFDTCEIDLTVGGGYRYVWRGPEGQLMGMRGTYHEIEPPNKLVSTEVFDDGFEMGRMLITLELSERDGKTDLIQTLLFESRAARDAAVASGMADGMATSYGSLDRFLAETGR